MNKIGKRDDTNFGKRDDTNLNDHNPHVSVQLLSLSSAKIDRKFKEFLRNKIKIIKNKNKLSA